MISERELDTLKDEDELHDMPFLSLIELARKAAESIRDLQQQLTESNDRIAELEHQTRSIRRPQ